jgi:hypothetical protein
MGTTYDHAKHAPGELEKILRGELNAAQLSLRQGMPEAAVAQAQNAYMKLTELRIRLESLQQAYELHRSQALHDVAILLQEVEKNRIFRLQGNDYELNFWTRGKAEAFQKELEEIRAKILADTLDVPGLEELRKRIQMQGARFTELLGEAGEAILVSQKRYLVADQIAGILGAQGYSIEEGVYASEDFREGYHLKMRMVDNSEVIVSILPEGSGNTIRVDTFEATPIDEEDLRARSEDLFARLAAQGVRVDPKGTCRKNTAPDETVRDFSRIRSGRPKAEEGRRGTRG